MKIKDEQFEQVGSQMFEAFLGLVNSNDLVTQCREDYYEQAGNVRHSVIPREHQSHVDYNIYFEILCYGAFGLSIAAVPYCTRKQLFGQVFDRSAWALIDEKTLDALRVEIAELDAKFPNVPFPGRKISSPVQEAFLAAVNYKQIFADYQASADMLVLCQRVKSLERLGCFRFSERMSYSIDFGFGEKWPAFNRQWIPFGQQILTETAKIAKQFLNDT